MTDNEILKALELCQLNVFRCGECPLYAYQDCRYRLNGYLLDLINRQQAEIEKVKPIHNSFERELECAKQEAIKEFAERLKEKLADKKYKYITETNYSKTVNAVIDACLSTVDNLEQEMVGEEDG